MGTARGYLGCFHIMDHYNVTNVVVVGGRNHYSNELSSAEILDTKTMKWQNLPNLPFGVIRNNGVESVVGPYLGFSLGGLGSSGTPETRIFGLKKEGENFQWEQLKSLSTPRNYLASVNAPSSMLPSC